MKSRLLQWEILPPPLQEEFLANDKALHYFANVETTNTTGLQQKKAAEKINRFFELTPEEKQQTLNTLSDNERAEMEKTLGLFDKLPPQQRLICVRNYAKFAGMSAGERAEFLKNADRWAKMSPQERQTWRDLVEQVPIWPPMPQLMLHQIIAPPVPIKTPQMLVATNLN